MLLKDLIRFSTQHRTLYCYMILSIWIFLLIAGMYKYVGHNGSTSLSQTFSFFNGAKSPLASSNLYSDSSVLTANSNDYDFGGGGGANEDATSPFHLSRARCSPIAQLQRHDEGGILEGWKLHGVLMVVRHGDRGPMSHVRSVEHIDCGIENDALVNRYRSFLYNSSSPSASNHMYWNKIGGFHGFPLLPVTDKACLLGQLTYKGIAQMLHAGEMLHQIYANPLGLFQKPPMGRSAASSGGGDTTPNSMLNSDEVIVYSTRYRRTFQSALAFLFSFLPPDKWLALNVRESYSMAFCFVDCACSQAEHLRRQLVEQHGRHLAHQPAVVATMQTIGATLLQHTPNGINDPNEVIDALLTTLCHDAPLPCRHPGGGTAAETTTEASETELSDVINIDQDDNTVAAGNFIGPDESRNSGGGTGAGSRVLGPGHGAKEGCVEPGQVHELIGYMNGRSKWEASHPAYRQIGLMRAYGMIRHIVSFMLRMISGDRTKFVLYSGHDWSLQYLTAALGIRTEYTYVPYAARLAIELYKSEAHVDYYFRVLYNGHDVTQQIDFCEGGRSLRVTRDSRRKKADLCPIENIIRFLHEDYFAPLNATNFKDACMAAPIKPNEF